jgi:hypothetical protein
LGKRYFELARSAPSAAAVGAALNVIEACAQFEGPTRPIHVRVAGAGERIYLDLADEAWRCVEIAADGWRIAGDPPVRFRRSAGTLPLPAPVAGGTVETLRSFVNVGAGTDFVLVIAWLLAALRHRGPYPVLVLAGEQGSAKSTTSAILRALVDPNVAPLRALPRDDRDLFIAANNGHLLAFDNVSGLPYWLSDTLCRLATGGGFATRQLYTDAEEVLFDAARPIILNGIEDMVSRPDLADRAIFLSLEPLGEARRRTEREMWASFRQECPRLLGALLDAMVGGISALPTTNLSRLPRMADFAQWISACESALWPVGSFSHAYQLNRRRSVDQLIELDPLASAIRRLMTGRDSWTGTATELLAALGKDEIGPRSDGGHWPDSPRALAGRLRRAAAFLRESGIDIVFARAGHSRVRTIGLTRIGAGG